MTKSHPYGGKNMQTHTHAQHTHAHPQPDVWAWMPRLNCRIELFTVWFHVIIWHQLTFPAFSVSLNSNLTDNSKYTPSVPSLTCQHTSHTRQTHCVDYQLLQHEVAVFFYAKYASARSHLVTDTNQPTNTHTNKHRKQRGMAKSHDTLDTGHTSGKHPLWSYITSTRTSTPV